jgi:putative ABC transport system substrate-binding protein
LLRSCEKRARSRSRSPRSLIPGLGFVASLARPGGNVTGFTNINIESSIGDKWLELLKEIAPAVRRVAMIDNPPTASFAGYYLRPFEAAGPASGVQASAAAVHSDADIENAIEPLAREPGGGFVASSSDFFEVRFRATSGRASSSAMRCHSARTTIFHDKRVLTAVR